MGVQVYCFWRGPAVAVRTSAAIKKTPAGRRRYRRQREIDERLKKQ